MLISSNRLKSYIKNGDKIDWLKVWDIFTVRTAEVEEVKVVGNQFDGVVIAEIKEAGLSDMVEDIFMGKLASALSESVAQNNKAKFDKAAKAVDDMIADYGEKANLKVAAIAFQTAFTEEVFDAAAAAARYEKYAALF